MVALPNNDYFWPRGDVISQRIMAVKKSIHQNRAAYVYQTRVETHREQRRPLLQDEYTPIMAWLLHQEVLYRQQVEKSQPSTPHSQPYEHPIYHVYHLRTSEVPCNIFYSALDKTVNYVGSFYDCFRSAWRFTHA